VFLDLCQHPLPAKCDCWLKNEQRLCPKHWDKNDAGYFPDCPSMSSFGGKSGDACSGYLRHDTEQVPKEGALKCDYCYGEERHRPWTNPIPGAACTGVTATGERASGLMTCD